ncbi:MAG: hypothetical protein R3B09_15345 [Nannocystaceae bacterium]
MNRSLSSSAPRSTDLRRRSASKGSEIQGGTVGSLAGKIAGNYSRMFSLVIDDGLSPLTATSPNIDDGGGSATIPE